jgi:SAM-dependent methyltransferase
VKLAELEGRYWCAERRSVLQRVLARHRGPGWAADVGAAAGGNTPVLQRMGWRAVGLEHVEPGATPACGRGQPACRADGQALPLQSGSCGLVVALDLLEHLPDDRRAAREMRRVLRPAGTLVVSVPANPGSWSPHDDAVSHLRRYTRPSLQLLLEEAGLEVQRLWCWNVLPRPLPGTRRSGLALEHHLPVPRRPGASLFAVCTPRAEAPRAAASSSATSQGR